MRNGPDNGPEKNIIMQPGQGRNSCPGYLFSNRSRQSRYINGRSHEYDIPSPPSRHPPHLLSSRISLTADKYTVSIVDRNFPFRSTLPME
jgi:hypothetical protein